MIATLADIGHRLGFSCWIGTRAAESAGAWDRGVRWATCSTPGASGPPYLGRIRAEDLEDVDVIWYVRGRGVPVRGRVDRDARRARPAAPPADAAATSASCGSWSCCPERVELVRYKLERSPLLRAALEAGGWHLLKSDHLRRVPGRADVPDLVDLEPLLGLDPAIERTGDQLPLFGG